MDNPVLGVALHSIGALSASCCYTPQKKTKLWAWEVYWISQASFAWLILPLLGAFIVIPDYIGFLVAAPKDDMLRAFLFGLLYGSGGLMFGLGIRYIGFSLNYAIAIGISAVLGGLLPLIVTPEHGFDNKLDRLVDGVPGLLVSLGILIAVGGIFLCGFAGALRERSGGSKEKFVFWYGVPLAVMAGLLSAVFNFALISGEPLAKLAHEEWKVNELVSMWVAYPFSHGGALVPSVIWCIILMAKNRTVGQLVRLPEQVSGGLPFYYLMALLSGAFWYCQFVFFSMGHSFLGEKFGFTSWIIHMALLILFSNIFGWLFSEWEGASKWPKRVLHCGMVAIVVATLLITRGNQLNKVSDEPGTDPPAGEKIEQETFPAPE